MTIHFTFTALGKSVDVHFNNIGGTQNIAVEFDGRQISYASGDILRYPESTMLLRGSALKQWEKKQLRLIAEDSIAAFIEMAVDTCELDSLNL